PKRNVPTADSRQQDQTREQYAATGDLQRLNFGDVEAEECVAGQYLGESAACTPQQRRQGNIEPTLTRSGLRGRNGVFGVHKEEWHPREAILYRPNTRKSQTPAAAKRRIAAATQKLTGNKGKEL